MALYKRKPDPYVYDAVQFLADKPIPCGVIFDPDIDTYYVTTIQGQNVIVNLGEWIIREKDGIHFYPCSDEIFRKSFDLKDEV